MLVWYPCAVAVTVLQKKLRFFKIWKENGGDKSRVKLNETCDECDMKLGHVGLTMTGDSLTRRRSCPCTERRNAQCCCYSHFPGPGSTGSRWPADEKEHKRQKNSKCSKNQNTDTGEKSGIYNPPSGYSFQVSHLWYRSTGSRSQRCRCRNILDSGPARWTPPGRSFVISLMAHMIEKLTNKLKRR